jgi:hypothetical protein
VTEARLRAFLARPRVATACLAIAGGAVLFQGGAKLLLWYWPYNLGGMVNQGVLLLAALGVALVAWLVARVRSDWRRAAIPLAALAGATLFVAASAASLCLVGGAPALGRFDHYLFSTDGCEFLVRFEHPPQRATKALALPTGERTVSQEAIDVDLGSLTAFQARCFYLTPAFGAGQTASAELWLRPYLTAWAAESKIAVDSLRFEHGADGVVAKLGASLAVSVLPPRDDGRPIRTRMESWTYVGRRSLMIVTTNQEAGGPTSAQALAFLEGVRRRPERARE